MQVATVPLVRNVFHCYCIRNHGSLLLRLLLHSLGLLLAVSGIFRFWISLEALSHLQFFFVPSLLLLFDWAVCALLECVAAEILFQVPWTHLKLQHVTKLRLFALIIVLVAGLTCVCSMWQLSCAVYDCVLDTFGYDWIVVPLWMAMITAMSHSIVLALTIPVQVIIVPLDCNRDAPNISFKRRNVTLIVNLWLLVHFVCLYTNYSSYVSGLHVTALLYRICSVMWLLLYCYPNHTYDFYHWLKQRLPNCIRPLLRVVRDSSLISKVWRNLRAVFELRRRENVVNDNRNICDTVNNLCSVWKSLITMLFSSVVTMLSCTAHYTRTEAVGIISVIKIVLLVLRTLCAELLIAVPRIVEHIYRYMTGCTFPIECTDKETDFLPIATHNAVHHRTYKRLHCIGNDDLPEYIRESRKQEKFSTFKA